MTTPRYLPGEMLNLIAANVPQEVYTVVNAFSPDRTSRFFDPQGKDLVEIIGTFSTIELANRAAEAFVKHKLEPMLQTEDSLHPTEKKRFKNGTMKWIVCQQGGHCVCSVETQKLTVREKLWEKTDMPLPVHGDIEHDDKCLCCNTAEEIEATKKADAEAEERECQRARKRKKIRILEELKELEKDKDLDAVDLDEETEPEDDSGENENESEDEVSDYERRRTKQAPSTWVESPLTVHQCLIPPS